MLYLFITLQCGGVNLFIGHDGFVSLENDLRFLPHLYISRYELPDEVLVWDELPVGGTGKISKKEIRKILETDGYKLPDLRNSSKL